MEIFEWPNCGFLLREGNHIVEAYICRPFDLPWDVSRKRTQLVGKRETETFLLPKPPFCHPPVDNFAFSFLGLAEVRRRFDQEPVIVQTQVFLNRVKKKISVVNLSQAKRDLARFVRLSQTYSFIRRPHQVALYQVDIEDFHSVLRFGKSGPSGRSVKKLEWCTADDAHFILSLSENIRITKRKFSNHFIISMNKTSIGVNLPMLVLFLKNRNLWDDFEVNVQIAIFKEF